MEPQSAKQFSAINLDCYRGEETLFSGLSFDLASGDVLQIAGENGSGKTSLLRILCGLSLADEGEVYWSGQPIRKNRSDFFAELVYVSHQNGIKDDLTALENLKIDSLIGSADIAITPEQALKQLDLGSRINVLCRSLSAGQKRRVGLARLLIRKAKLWLIDEPVNALDQKGRCAVENIIRNHSQKGGITIYTTHFPLELGDCPHRTVSLSE